MMRGVASIAVCAILSVGVLFAIARPTEGQEATVDSEAEIAIEAPRFNIGDRTDVVDAEGVDRSTVVEINPDGMAVRWELANGWIRIDTFDLQFNLVNSESKSSADVYQMKPSALKYQFPFRIGDEWSGEYMVISLKKAGSGLAPFGFYETVALCRVECIEPVTIAPGTFEAVRIRCERQRSDQAYASQTVSWYAPALGVSIRNETSRLDTGEIVGTNEVHEFHRATLAPFELSPAQRAATACAQPAWTSE